MDRGGQAVGRRPMGRLRRFKGIQRLDAARRDLPRHRLQGRMLRLGGFPPFRQLANSAAGVGSALSPVGSLAGNGGSARRAHRMVAGQRLAFGLRRGFRRSSRRQRRPRRLHGIAQGHEVRQRGLRFEGLSKARVGFLGFSGQPLDLGVDASQPCCDLGRSRTKLLMGHPCPLESLFGVCPARACLLFGNGRRLIGFGRGLAHLARGRNLIACRSHITLQQRQPVALLQPDGRRGRRPCADGIAVPAPDGARTRDQHLARRQTRLRPFAYGGILHQSGLRQHACQCWRRLDQRCQRRRATGQFGCRVEWRQFAPMPCRVVVGGRGQLLAQSRPERCFQAGGHTQRIDHRRPALAILHRQHLG